MNPQSRLSALLLRILMFAAMLALIVYVMHFVLPAPAQNEAGAVSLNPALQVGLFFTLTVFAALIGFWITFGDLVNRKEK